MSTIKFQITKEETIKEVQEKFAVIFPYLRIGFFKKANDDKKVSTGNTMFCNEVRLEQINPRFLKGDFEITDNMTVDELENSFQNNYGLNAQILRKSGNLWIGTSISNHWTLKEQNDLGKEISPEAQPVTYFKQVPYGC